MRSAVNFLWLVALTCFLCIFGLVTSAAIHRAITNQLQPREEVPINVRTLIARAGSIVVLIIMFFLVLGIWNIQIALPAAIVTGVLTFAFNGLIKDLISGVLLLMDHPFQIGDLVTIDVATGFVTNINLRVTTIRLLTGAEMIIPNGHFLDQNVTNNTRYVDRYAVVAAVFAQEDYQEQETPRQLLKVIKSTPIVNLENEPIITLNTFTGRVKGYQPPISMSGYNNQTVVLTIGFLVSNNLPSASTEVMEALGKAFPCADFNVIAFGGIHAPVTLIY